VDCSRFNHRPESLREINSRSLCKSPKNPMSFVTLKRTISCKLVFENPLAGDHIALRWSRD